MAASSKRNPRKVPSAAATVLHPTKGLRRVSFKRIMAQGLIQRQRAIMGLLGAAVR